MTKVIDGDDQHDEGSSLGEIDILARLLDVYGDEETRARRGKEEQERKMFLIDTITSAAIKASSGEGMIDHACNSLQNPSYRHGYASSSSSLSSVESKSRLMVSDEPIRAEPIREIKPPVRRKGPVKKEPVRTEPGVTPEWVVNLMREKNGVDAVRLIIEKEITASDLKKDQGRLLMPFNQMADMNFLNEAELESMEEYVQKTRKKGVDVILVDSDGTQWELNLRTWGMKTSSNYCLCTGWNSVVLHYKLERRKLKEGQSIRLWSFHSQDGKLFFAFLRLPPAPAPGMAQPQAQDPDQAMALPQAQDPDQAMALPQAQDPDQAMALPQAEEPEEQAMALALVPAISTASSSSMAPVVTPDSNDLCKELPRIGYPIPKRKRTPRVCVPAPTRDSGDLDQSILEGLDLNKPLPQVCTEIVPLEAVQETDRRTSLVSVTETSLVSVTETSLVSVTETSLVSDTEETTLDLELRL